MDDLIYEVTVAGVASDAVRAAFDDYEVQGGLGTIKVRCTPAGLLGVLDRMQDLGLELVELTSHEPPSTC